MPTLTKTGSADALLKKTWRVGDNDPATYTLLGSDGNTTNSSSYNTSSLTVNGSTRAYSVFVAFSAASGLTDGTLSGLGLTWTQREATVATNGTSGIFLFTAVGQATNGTLTASPVGATGTGWGYAVLEWTGADITTNDQAVAFPTSNNTNTTSGTSLALNLDPTQGLAWAGALILSNTDTVTNGKGTEIVNVSWNSPSRQFEVQTGTVLGNDVISASWTTLSGARLVGVTVAFRPLKITALLKAQLTVTHSVRAVILKTQTLTHSIDADLLQIRSVTHSIDALVSKRGAVTHSIDAKIGAVATSTKTYSLDSDILKTQTKTHSIDANIKKTLTKTHSIDASKVARGLKTASVDVLLKKTWRVSDNQQPTYAVLDSAANTNNGTTYTTNSMTVAGSNKAYSVFVAMSAASGLTDVTISGLGLTWTQRISNIAANQQQGMFLFTAVGSASNGTLTFTPVGATGTGWGYVVLEWTGADVFSDDLLAFPSVGQANTTGGTSVAIDLDPSPGQSWVGAFGVTDVVTVNNVNGTEIIDTSFNFPDRTFEAHAGTTLGNDVISASWSISTGARAAGALVAFRPTRITTLLKKTTTKTHSVDVSLVNHPQKTHALDGLIKKTQVVTHSIDASLTRAVGTVTHSIDARINKTSLTQTHSFDVKLGSQTLVSHSIDALRTKPSKNIVQGVQTVLLRKTQTKAILVDAYLYAAGSSPVTDGSLESAIAAPIQRPSLRLSRVLNRNMVAENAPSLTVSQAGNGNSNLDESLIDGYDRSSMKWAFADSDTTTNGEYRIFPDLDKFEAEAAVERQKLPWVSSTLTNTSGTFPTPIVFTVHYSGAPEFNMIQIVTDQYGKGGGGIITSCDFEVSNNGTTWTTVGNALSGFSCTENHKVKLMYYRDQNTLTTQWTTDEETFIANTDGVPRESVTFQYVRVTVRSVSVNSYLATVDRARLGQFYEVGAYLWDIGLQDVDIVSFSVNEARDISQQTLSPVGSSSANSFSISGTMANQPTPYYNTYVNPLSNNNDKFQGALYIAELGFNTGSEITYVDYGKFWADDVSMSGPDGKVNISGRDFSKLLQETKMADMVYVDSPLEDVIRDVVQRAGIEYYRIDNPDYTLAELSPAFFDEFYSNDEVERTLESSVIWTQGQTCWEFLQSIAYADLGVFYFDRDNYFVYKSKEDLLRGSVTPDHILTEGDDIFNFNTRSEMLKNAFTITYKAPVRTDTPIGLWTLDTNTALGVTGLGANIGADDETIPAGDIQDWLDQGYFQIDDEIVRYNSRSNDTFLECDRGWLGTQAASHTMITSSGNWNYGGSGTWTVSGGVLTATNNGGAYDSTLSVNTVGGDSINFYATVTINTTPFSAGLAIRGQNLNNHYYVVFKTAKNGPIDGATAATDTNMYEIWQISGGSRTLLRGVPFNKAKRKMVTGVPYRLQVHMNDDEISLFVKGTRVISYTIKDADLQVDTPAKVGFLAQGNGPTVFENAAVTTLPEDKGGEILVFSDPFGESIREIRKFEATYAPTGDGKLAATPPSWGVRYYLTNSNYASVILFNAGPFSSTLFVRNDVDFTESLIAGALSDNQVPEQLYLTGYAIHQDLQQKEQRFEDWDAITRYGRQELTLDVPWVQSDTHAKKLLRYLRQAYSLPTLFLNATVRANPMLRLGEIAAVQAASTPIWFPAGTSNKFYITGSNMTFDSSGWHQTIDLRSVTWDQSFTDNGHTDQTLGL